MDEVTYTHKSGDVFKLWTSKHGIPHITRFKENGEALISFEFSSYEEREKAINQALSRGSICKIKGFMDKGKLFMKKKILEVLATQADGFIIPNQSDFANDDTHELFYAIDSLIEAGILRRRNCEGLAYEMVPSLEAQVKAAELYKAFGGKDGSALDREIER